VWECAEDMGESMKRGERCECGEGVECPQDLAR
jgi:hypothetical protein